MIVSKDTYSFLSREILRHPEIPQWSAEELKSQENNMPFWDELSEHIDCLRICDICHRPMIEGYCIDDGRANYCSDDCLHHDYSDEEFQEMYNDGEGNSYWTVWWE